MRLRGRKNARRRIGVQAARGGVWLELELAQAVGAAGRKSVFM
jgi:hypothetical protein